MPGFGTRAMERAEDDGAESYAGFTFTIFKKSFAEPTKLVEDIWMKSKLPEVASGDVLGSLVRFEDVTGDGGDSARLGV